MQLSSEYLAEEPWSRICALSYETDYPQVESELRRLYPCSFLCFNYLTPTELQNALAVFRAIWAFVFFSLQV
jgi:hypothetical protein